MAVDVRAFVAAALLAAAVLGIAWGAELQKETFLHPDKLIDLGNQDAASNLVTLTALIPAMAVAAALGLWSQQPPTRRVLPAAVVFVATYLIVWLVQSAWPNYDAIAETRTARFSITPLVSNGAAVPSVFLGPMAILVALCLVWCEGARRLIPAPASDGTATGLLKRFLGAYCLAAPFLVVAAVGNVRLLLGLPDENAAAAAYLIIVPLAALASLGLLTTGAVKAWHLGGVAMNGRLADAADEAWVALQKAEWVMAGVLAGLALLSTFLAAIPAELLEAGRTFSVTTRGHMQAHILLLFPLVPWFLLDRPVRKALQAPPEGVSLEVGTHPRVVALWVALGSALLGAVALEWILDGALWSWVAALAPFAVLSFTLPARESAAAPLALGVVLWGIGNTVVGAFSLRVDTALVLETDRGALALARVVAVALAAVVAGRVARARSRGVPASSAWPMTLVASLAVALVILMELPFNAWIAPTADGEFVGIGSLVASQDQAVRTTLHAITSVLGFAAGLVASRLLRPEWFQRASPPLPTIVPAA